MTTPGLISNRFTIADPGRDLLGRGGMGAVYRASDTQTGETVAVKALSPEVLARDPSLLERFQREGEALRRLNHPNIVRLVAAVEEDGQQYLVMEYVPGGSLEDLLARQGRLPHAQAVEIALDLADALTRAHRLGILHRDLKPANVLLDADGAPKLADFGIAYRQSTPHLTQTGVLVGTVDYLSPEACQGEKQDEKSDIWAFGVLLFQLLSGRLPFAGANLTARLTAILTQPVPDLAQLAPDIPVALLDLVYRMLEKDPQQRIPSVRLVGTELEAILQGRQTPTHVIRQKSAISSPIRNAPKHNLPVQLTSFLGREYEIEGVKMVLQNHRLVTLTGSGGVGKTRLSLQVAAGLLDIFKDGIWFIELAPISDPAFIPNTVASVLGLREETGRSIMATITDWLSDKKCLFILDNCEHLIQSCAGFVDAVLHTRSDTHILASSREPLGLAGETVWRVPPLATPNPKQKFAIGQLEQYDAVRLFIERATLVLNTFRADNANLPAIAQVCHRLDGIPLAIELAASRIRLFTPLQIAERLDDRFRLLTSGNLASLPHQQTLRALIDWSYDLLPDLERVLFRRLSIFAGGWSFDAAEAIGHSDQTLDLLAALINKSLVVADQTNGENRYHYLETIRQYAYEKLLESDDLEDTRLRHLYYYKSLIEAAETKIQGPDMVLWMNRLELEQDNLRSALEWAHNTDPVKALQIVSAACYFWSRRASATEGLGWIKAALERAEASLDTQGQTDSVYLNARARALAAESMLAFDSGDSRASLKAAEASVFLARQGNMPRTLAWSLTTGAAVIRFLGDNTLARAWAKEAFDLSRQQGYLFELGLSLAAMQLASGPENLEELESMRSFALPKLRQGGNLWVLSLNILAMARVAEMSGNLSETQACYKESASLFDALGDRHYYNASRSMQAHMLRRHGRYSESLAIYRETIHFWYELGHLLAVAHELECFAFIAGELGESLQAVMLLGAAEKIRKEYGSPMSSTERIEYEQTLARLHANIDQAAFDKSWFEGRSMTVEEAIAFAINDER